MRSVLVELGPWQWPAVLVIAAVFLLAVLAWRKVEERVEGHVAPLDARWFLTTGLIIAVLSVGLFLIVNQFGPVKIRSYGVMLLVGFICGFIYLTRVGPPRGLGIPTLLDLLLVELVAAIVGARLLFVLLMLGEYAENPETVLDVWQGGLSFHGGLLGAIIATVWFARARRIRFAVLADICTPGIPIGYGLTRIGCFLNGCCHGGPTHSCFGIVMPETGYAEPLHPTQLYASAGSFLLFFILVRAWPRMRRPGQLLPLYMVLYSILRFLCEYTRYGFTAEKSGLIPSLSVAQVACIFIAAAGLAIFVHLQRLPAENPVTAMAVAPESLGAPLPEFSPRTEGHSPHGSHGRRRSRHK